ncbi:S8 family peptidase [Sphingomonas sp. SORGH_AS_0438]|uniref:S8 family peptidase n=1 Tax=Sphingomonas sp. SORGH_AS_0438 TaxID=3041756 RepID=UPI00285D6909|nr:S8 family peptidase [Sphingomonas sp. SORGH_AS_0438]MDR6127111.1 hypothetical protein [Sphingomonas sp. SORGH_AS_0438]
MPVYPHIHLRGLGKRSIEFRAVGRGSNTQPAPVPHRGRHAKALRSQLKIVGDALADAIKDQKSAGVALKERGLAITATGRQNIDVRVGSLKLNSRGLQLLSLKQPGRGPNAAQVANFFVTKSQLESLNKALDKYEGYKPSDGDRPRRFNFFETVSTFKPATIEDLWTDEEERIPDDDEFVEWEVWIRRDAQELFKRYIKRLEIETTGNPVEFVDTAVFNILATSSDITTLIRSSAAIVELRGASSFVADYLDFDPEDRVAAASAFVTTVTAPTANGPITTILDTGVNYANPLVGVALRRQDCKSIDPSWITNDHSGHGTNMAGVALYGDLEEKVEAGLPVTLLTSLESIVIAAPQGEATVPGYDAIQRAVALLPDDQKSRVFCLAQTAPGDLSDGRQSTLSGVVDRLAWNGGERTRLICVAAGNAQGTLDKRYPTGPYDMRNADYRIESPGQAVNALTVGACTHRCSDDWVASAPTGDLCPSSRTSQLWDIHYAYKPDIVMEGGNHEVDGDDPLFTRPTKQSMLLTVGHNYPNRPFDWTGETSAATARAAGLATRLQAQYPEFRAETLRGLMVHSADWSSAMLARKQEVLNLTGSKAGSIDALLQCYGWGVPDEAHLFRSAGDALTLIAEDNLQPYKLNDGRLSLREMKYFKLPWPIDVLKGLNQEEVELRCTLSYFADPDPHGSSRSRWDRYPSHRMRFDMKRPGETDLEAQQRVNLLASEEDVEDLDDDQSGLGVVQSDIGWFLGDRKRRRGTIHHDIWTGKAYDLAERDGVSVYPVRGWWGDRKGMDFEDRTVGFSLIMSIRTKRTDVDLYAETTTKISTRNRVAAPTLIVT